MISKYEGSLVLKRVVCGGLCVEVSSAMRRVFKDPLDEGYPAAAA